MVQKTKRQQPTVARIHLKVRKSEQQQEQQREEKNLVEKCDDRRAPPWIPAALTRSGEEKNTLKHSGLRKYSSPDRRGVVPWRSRATRRQIKETGRGEKERKHKLSRSEKECRDKPVRHCFPMKIPLVTLLRHYGYSIFGRALKLPL